MIFRHKTNTKMTYSSLKFRDASSFHINKVYYSHHQYDLSNQYVFQT